MQEVYKKSSLVCTYFYFVCHSIFFSYTVLKIIFFLSRVSNSQVTLGFLIERNQKNTTIIKDTNYKTQQIYKESSLSVNIFLFCN